MDYYKFVFPTKGYTDSDHSKNISDQRKLLAGLGMENISPIAVDFVSYGASEANGYFWEVNCSEVIFTYAMLKFGLMKVKEKNNDDLVDLAYYNYWLNK